LPDPTQQFNQELFVMPGGFAIVPFLAWWLDRRRKQRANQIKKTLILNDTPPSACF
jgi:hypothetical protein